MYTDDYEFDYDRILDDTDDLYDYADYSDEPEYDYVEDDSNEYDYYYHNVLEELDTE